MKGATVPGLFVHAATYVDVSSGLSHVVVTKEPSTVVPTVQGSDGVAAKLVAGGWLHVVVIQSGDVPGVDAPHDATGVV
jgi:hypothetical protein